MKITILLIGLVTGGAVGYLFKIDVEKSKTSHDKGDAVALVKVSDSNLVDKKRLTLAIEQGLAPKWVGGISYRENRLHELQKRGAKKKTDVEILAQAIRSVVADAVVVD